jgi:hypothetical protein
MRRALSFAIAVTLAACAAPSQQVAVAPAAPAFDPVGVYDFSTQADGQTVNGTLTIRRGEEGRLNAVISTPVTGDVPIENVTLEGRTMELRANVEGTGLIMMVDFVENRLTGGWQLSSGASGVMTGQRRGG